MMYERPSAWILVGGIGFGAAAMYFLDPVAGEKRREAVTSAVNRLIGRTGSNADTAVRAAVRGCLARCISYARSIDVTAANGRVTLTGRVLERDLPGLIATVGSVPGVKQLESRLIVYDAPHTAEFSRRPEWFSSMTARSLAGALGGGMAVYAYRIRGARK